MEKEAVVTLYFVGVFIWAFFGMKWLVIAVLVSALPIIKMANLPGLSF